MQEHVQVVAESLMIAKERNLLVTTDESEGLKAVKGCEGGVEGRDCAIKDEVTLVSQII